MFRANCAGAIDLEHGLESNMTKSFPHRPRHVRGQARLARRVQIFKKRLGRLSALRLALFVGGVGLPLALLQAGGSGTVVLSGAPLFVAFGFVFYFYGRLQRKLRLAEGQLANYAEDQARGEPGWWNRLPASDAPPGIADDHPYSDDLSLFGRFSVFQHFDRTATPVGRARLVELLTSQPDAVALDASAHAARTDGIRFLARRSVFRQRWRREGRPLAETYRRLFDLSWIAGIQNLPDARMPRVLVWIAYILPAITLGTYIGFEMQWTRAYFLLTLPVQFVLFFILHFRHHHLAGTHAKIVDQLSGLDALFRVAAGLGGMNQSEPAAGLDRQPHLRALSVTASGPAREIRLLSSLAGYFSFRRNPLLHGLAGIFFLYEAHVVFALGAWQRRCRADFARWFVDLAELDALLACACVGDTEPDCCFAENLDHSDDSESALYVEARNQRRYDSNRAKALVDYGIEYVRQIHVFAHDRHGAGLRDDRRAGNRQPVSVSSAANHDVDESTRRPFAIAVVVLRGSQTDQTTADRVGSGPSAGVVSGRRDVTRHKRPRTVDRVFRDSRTPARKPGPGAGRDSRSGFNRTHAQT